MSVRIARVKASEIEVPSVLLRSMDDETFKALVRSIAELGYVEPVQVVEKCNDGYMVLNGVHRLTVLRDILRADEVDVVVVGRLCCPGETGNCMSTEDYYLNAIRLNSIHGRWNPQVLREVLRQLQSKYSPREIQARTGSSRQIARLLGEAKAKSQRDSVRRDVQAVCREIALGDYEQGAYIAFTFGNRMVIVHRLESMEEFSRVAGMLEELKSRGLKLSDVLAVGLKCQSR
ncbi:MAG: ParB N-terminal domain-containing protein [Thermofilaceae archaeon]